MLLKGSLTEHSPGKNITSPYASHSLINWLIQYNLAANSQCCVVKASGTFLRRTAAILTDIQSCGGSGSVSKVKYVSF